MRATNPLIRIAAAAFLGLAIPAPPADAQTWEHAYDASLGTKPSAQGFTHVVDDPPPADGLSEANYTVAGGLLTQGPTGGGSDDDANRQSYQLASESIDFDRDVIVVEANVRVIDSTYTAPPTLGSRAGFGFSVTDRNGQPIVAYVGSGGAFLWGSDLGTSPFVVFDATDVLHDYVLRIDPAGASLSLDGSEIATLSRANFGAAGTTVPSRFQIGDLTILERSTTELASFRISRYAVPIPEVRNYQVVTQTTASNSNASKTLTVACPAGTVALTGGASTDAGAAVGVSESYPGAGTPSTSWTGSARELVATGASWDLRVDVVCGEVSGYERVQSAEPQSTDPDPFAFLACPGTKRSFSGGVALSGTPLAQTITSSVYLGSLIDGPRWLAAAQDFGAVTSSSAWGIDIHAICSDSTRQEHLEDQSALVPGSPRSMVLNCRGGKLPIGGGAIGGDGGLAWSRPKDGAIGEPPVGWDAQARGSGSWQIGVRMDCAPLADPTVSANGLMSRFRAEFDAEDSWGWAHGTLTNGPTFEPGIEGQAFDFDGVSDQWVSVPSQTFNELDGIDYYPAADFTVAAWIQSDGVAPLAQPHTIIVLYDPGGTASANWSTWYMNLQVDGHLRGYLRGPNNQFATAIVDSPAPVTDGSWHHVAFSRNLNDAVLRLYVDGALVDEEALVAGTTDQPLVPGTPGFGDPVAIGAFRLTQSTALTNLFDGRIDEVAYWDRALTLEEIQNVAGCHRPISDRVLNLDAERFASPLGAEHALCVFLEAGQYPLTLVDPVANADARFTGWSPGPAMPWGTAFSVDPEIDSGFVFGLPLSETSGQAAFDATLDKQTVLTLSQAQRVRFSLVDATAFDNRGGVSIALPEPGSWQGFAAGVVLLLGVAGRRRRRARV